MAKLFLSYARGDRDRVEPLAHFLERAGHEVWWDRRIAGGSQFSAAIADALAAADAVIVAWSEASLHSDWVRDEAAEGRDRARLIPVLLDPVLPPLGFRQYQVIDLSDWHGEGEPESFGGLLEAVDSVASADQPVRRAPAPRRRRRKPVKPWVWVLLGAAGLFALFVVIAALPEETGPNGGTGQLARPVQPQPQAQKQQEPQAQPQQPSAVDAPQGFVFSPERCEFGVTFPQTPRVEGSEATLTLPDGTVFYVACGVMNATPDREGQMERTVADQIRAEGGDPRNIVRTATPLGTLFSYQQENGSGYEYLGALVGAESELVIVTATPDLARAEPAISRFRDSIRRVR